MQVAECAVVQLANGVLADADEQHVADLVQHHHDDAPRAIGDDQHGDAEREVFGRGDLGLRQIKRQPIGRPFEGDGHGYGDQLGHNEHDNGQTRSADAGRVVPRARRTAAVRAAQPNDLWELYQRDAEPLARADVAGTGVAGTVILARI